MYFKANTWVNVRMERCSDNNNNNINNHHKELPWRANKFIQKFIKIYCIYLFAPVW